MLKPGMILCDRYEILEVVGAGGMSIVYKARCHRLNRNVAIKVLKPEFSNDKNFVTKFRTEAQASAGLTHPNIVNVFDVYDDEGMYFIVMELVDGITLKEYIADNGRLSMDKAIDFSIQIASGLEAAHESHVIHRDIKPQNIIVSKNGNIKVTDFGIAKAASPDTLTSGAMGSVHYISPEQARGGYSDERSDIYSLGITMYEMVTGRVPFEGENNVSIALMHIQNDMISPRQYYPDIYSSFEKIILKATQKKPERRYLTASALIADLKRVQNNPNIDIVVASSAVTNSPTQQWTKEDVKAIRDGSAQRDMSGGSQLDAFAENTPIQNEMGELQPIGGISTIPINNQRINRYFEEEEYPWEEEEPVEPVRAAEPRKAGIKKVQDYEEPEYEDEDDGDLDPGLKKAVMIGGIASAIIIFIVLVIIGMKLAGIGLFASRDKQSTEASEEQEDFVMIDVKGYSEEAAKKMLVNSGVPEEMIKIEYESNSEVQEGYVIEQSLEEGKVLSAGDTITLIVSGGAEMVDVPNVVNYTDEQATTVLREAGFEVAHAYDYDENIEKDKVIKTEPEAGSQAPKGTKVIITVSNGAEVKETVVPNLNGYTEAQAVNSLTTAKLQVGEVSHAYDENVKEGYVISQSPLSNTTINEGESVDFVISDGPEPKNTTYTANISGRITCNNEELDGQAVTVQVLFDGTAVYEKTITVSAGSAYDVSASQPGLSAQGGSGDIVVIDSEGSNVTASFTKDVSTTFDEVTE